MRVIGFLNSKGGVGKSTLCAAVAVRAAQESKRVCIVDLDPQESIADWWRRRGEPDNPSLFAGEDRASDALDSLQLTGWDWVFLDGPPGSLIVSEDAIAVSDLVVIPMRASSLDLIASQDAVSLCQESDTPHVVVFNFCKGGGAKDKLLNDARSALETGRVPVAATAITQRTPYITAMTKGGTANEKDTAASEEIDALWREIKAAAMKATRGRTKKRGA